MSVYKSDAFDDINRAIISILNQTKSNVTLFIYRDGPVSPEVDDLLLSFSMKDNVKLINGSINKGLAYAMNSLIDLVNLDETFHFVARMDSDDISLPFRLERQVIFMINNPLVDVCGTSCREFGASFSLEEKHLPISHDELLNFSVTRCPFIHPTVMFRRNVFLNGTRYPTNTKLTEDMALWFSLLRQGFRFANLNEILLEYRLNENTIARRSGFKKGFNEFSLRLKFMFDMHKVSFKNLTLVFFRLFFHLLPESFIKFLYKNAR